jgi:predicted nucleic acid-binding protein
VLVDTSVWIDHFRRSNAQLERLLDEGRVSTHPFVIGELACGSLARRSEVLQLMAALPSAAMATHDEVIAFVDHQRLHGTGLGWIDAHLLASARLARQALWTVDKRLRAAALRLGLTERE